MINNYEVIKKLGSGAMGDVFKARNTKSGEIVAIKILSEDLCDNPRAIERFKREIRQVIQLDHPNLISAYTCGEYKGRLYYAMEYVDGITTQKELLANGPYKEARAVDIMTQVARALEHAHQYRIIHRDIKPDNIMVIADGRAKLCDMGLAKSAESKSKVTMEGTVVGTPHYMSPEQAQGEEDLDTRSDIFSLGATFYHFLTGTFPFEGQNPVTIMTRVIQENPTPIQELAPEVSDATCALVAKMMAKDRRQRYQNFSEVLGDLEKLQKREAGDYTSKARDLQKKFQECYVPSDLDVLLARIALHNKIATSEQIESCLNRQESLALTGLEYPLSYIMVERRLINAQQEMELNIALRQFTLNRFDEAFLKVSEVNNLLPGDLLQEAQKIKKSGQKGVAGLIVSRRMINDETRKKIFASVRYAIGGEEYKAILKAAMENGLLSKSQAEKSSRIYSNNIVMGEYRDIGTVLNAKKFMHMEAYQALLRAIRRSPLTGKPIALYLQQLAK